MDYRRSPVPAFGSWAWEDDLPFTQCFDSVRQHGLVRYSTTSREDDDADLYVAGDLYDNDVATPAIPKAKSHYPREREDTWVVCEVMEPPSFVSSPPPPPPPRRKAPKPVDEDLYKISPELLHSNPKTAKSNYHRVRAKDWVTCEVMEPQNPVTSPPPPPPPPPPRRAPKPVDEDLYKICPELLHSNPKTKRRRGFFSSCLRLTCG